MGATDVVFFAFDWSVLAIGLGASILACLVGARLPSGIDPAAALSASRDPSGAAPVTTRLHRKPSQSVTAKLV